jgi:hypothetical protein
MAGFGESAGTAQSSNTALGTEALLQQQQFLTAPQHA